MSSLLKYAVVIAVLSGIPTLASAESIQLGSFATGTASFGDANTAMNFAGYSASSTAPSSGTGNTYTLAPDSVWSVPLSNSNWVGFTPTAGPVGTSNPAFGYYTFTTTFTATSSNPYSGSLTLMADDTAAVYLNGTLLMGFGPLGSDAHCADSGASCLASMSIGLSNLSLLTGVNANTLTFVVEQAGNGPTGGINDPSGIDFDASLSTIPEPASLILLGTGLLGLAGAKLRRTRAQQALCPTR